jgi:nicotinamidase/pyrazinamidase
VGQSKPASLLTGNPSQIILEKQELDLFSNPKTDELLREFSPTECFVYGVVTEFCVKKCCLGLLDRGHKVTLVTRAIQRLSETVAAEFLREFTARGGFLWADL